MPNISCIVASCKTQRKCCTGKQEVITCFSLPKDPALKQVWLDLCKVKDFDPLKDSARKVCIKHFKEDDFIDGLKARLMNLQPRRLKKDAAPSLHLTEESQKEIKDIESRKRVQICKKMLNDNKQATLKEFEDGNKNSVNYLSNLVPIAPKGAIAAEKQEKVIRKNEIKHITKHEDNSMLKPQVKIDISEHRIRILQNDNAIHKKRIQELLNNTKKLKERIEELERKSHMDNQCFNIKVKKLFSNFLTSNQIDVILHKKIKPKWSDIEYSKAYTLLNLSKEAYVYVKDTLNYPLPAFGTLKNRASKYGVVLRKYETVLPMSNAIKLDKDMINKNYKTIDDSNMTCDIKPKLEPLDVTSIDELEFEETNILDTYMEMDCKLDIGVTNEQEECEIHEQNYDEVKYDDLNHTTSDIKLESDEMQQTNVDSDQDLIVYSEQSDDYVEEFIIDSISDQDVEIISDSCSDSEKIMMEKDNG